MGLPFCVVVSAILAGMRTRTYTAVAITENTYLGRTTNGGMNVWKHMPKEYIVGALFPVTLRLMNTIKTFPNLPTG